MMSETLVQTAYGKVQGVQEGAVSSPRLPQDTGGATREPLRLGADPGRTVDGGRLLVWNLVESSQPMVQRMVGDAPERLRLAHQMQWAWIVFALHGVPSTPELPTWPSYDLERRATMLLDREARSEATQTTRRARAGQKPRGRY